MRRPALMQNVDIITEKSREKFVPVWKRRRTWRHGDRSESGGHDESNKRENLNCTTPTSTTPRAGREPLLSGYTRLIQISDLSSMFLLPGIRKCKWGYTQHSYHAEFVSRKLPVQRITAYSLCIFNPSALNVARKSAISRHQKRSIFQLLNFLPRPFNSNDRRESLYMARDGRALLCICMLSVSDGRCSLI